MIEELRSHVRVPQTKSLLNGGTTGGEVSQDAETDSSDGLRYIADMLTGFVSPVDAVCRRVAAPFEAILRQEAAQQLIRDEVA